MSPHERDIGFVAFNRVPSTLEGHERCTVSDPGSRSGHGTPYPCTQCGQLCGQLGTNRGQAGRPKIRPHLEAGVPTASHHLSTSAPRSLACRNEVTSTPSTLLTTAVVVISSRTLLFTNVGDERLGRGGPPANRPRTATSTTGPGTVVRGVAAGSLRGACADPGYQQGLVWPYGGTPRGTTPRTPVGTPVDPQTAVPRISLLVSARPRPWRSSR